MNESRTENRGMINLTAILLEEMLYLPKDVFITGIEQDPYSNTYKIFLRSTNITDLTPKMSEGQYVECINDAYDEHLRTNALDKNIEVAGEEDGR